MRIQAGGAHPRSEHGLSTESTPHICAYCSMSPFEFTHNASARPFFGAEGGGLVSSSVLGDDQEHTARCRAMEIRRSGMRDWLQVWSRQSNSVSDCLSLAFRHNASRCLMCQVMLCSRYESACSLQQYG